MPDQCGAITMPTARVMPSAAICATASGTNGGECFMPRYARYVSGPAGIQPLDQPVGLRARRVRAAGTTLPIAS